MQTISWVRNQHLRRAVLYIVTIVNKVYNPQQHRAHIAQKKTPTTPKLPGGVPEVVGEAAQVKRLCARPAGGLGPAFPDISLAVPPPPAASAGALSRSTPPRLKTVGSQLVLLVILSATAEPLALPLPFGSAPPAPRPLPPSPPCSAREGPGGRVAALLVALCLVGHPAIVFFPVL